MPVLETKGVILTTFATDLRTAYLLKFRTLA
jgi:hypothetical protein